MLQLTHAAAAQVALARESQGLPDTFGLRVFGEQQAEGGLSLSLAFAEEPSTDDHVSEQEGTRLFVAPEVFEPLAGAALDVQETAEGTALVLTRQEAGLGD
jgi:Fe-S cluster assembly iron-binding protein IscA